MQTVPQRRKIALFSTSFLPYSQTFIYDEIRTHSNSYSIEVFCKERLNPDRFPYSNYHKPSGKLAEVIYENTAYWPKFDRIIRNGNFDLIHAHFGTGAVYALPYIKKYKLPFVVTFHGHDVAALMGTQKYHYSRWRYYFKSKSIFKKADLLLAASEELRALLIELGADEQKVKVYHLGIDLNKFEYSEPSPSTDTVSFIMVGRFTPKKGHKYALKALNRVIKEGYKANLSFIGSGELQSELEAFVTKNDLHNHVHFKGVMSPADVAKELQASDVLIAPSVVTFDHDRESGLIVVKEASATGRPVIGTWHGGIHEIIEDNKTGFLVPERNADQLAKQMIELIRCPGKRKDFGLAGRKKMEDEYNLNQQVKKLEQHYESLLDQAR
jgi:glycosyltransferase involved in cell wall biosynthesis